jgi:hypothetical protein
MNIDEYLHKQTFDEHGMTRTAYRAGLLFLDCGYNIGSMDGVVLDIQYGAFYWTLLIGYLQWEYVSTKATGRKLRDKYCMMEILPDSVQITDMRRTQL